MERAGECKEGKEQNECGFGMHCEQWHGYVKVERYPGAKMIEVLEVDGTRLFSQIQK